MTRTERKLDEAKYFKDLLNTNDPYFDYVLGAFLNAARSISWIMRHEYGKVEGWEKWFKEYNLSEKSKQLLQKINDLRIESVKTTGVKTDFYWQETELLIDEASYPELKKLLNIEDGEYLLSITPYEENKPRPKNEEGTYSFLGTIDRSRQKAPNSREDLLQLCNEYYDLMKEIVTVCSSNFSNI